MCTYCRVQGHWVHGHNGDHCDTWRERCNCDQTNGGTRGRGMNMNIRLRILTRGLGELAMSIHWRADLTLDDTSCCNWQAAALDYYADKASARRQLCASARVGLREFLFPQILPTPANGGLHEKTSADALQTLPAAVLLRKVCTATFERDQGTCARAAWNKPQRGGLRSQNGIWCCSTVNFSHCSLLQGIARKPGKEY